MTVSRAFVQTSDVSVVTRTGRGEKVHANESTRTIVWTARPRFLTHTRMLLLLLHTSEV